MKTEYKRLIDEYLSIEPTVYYSKLTEPKVLPQCELFGMLHNLQPFDHPDMYANYNEKIYVLEHFYFDASKETRKGMSGRQREDEINKEINSVQIGDEWHIERVSCKVSPKDYQKNFEKHFDEHYGKIHSYQNNLLQRGIAAKGQEFVIGFWIECLYPPCYTKNGRFKGELFYFETVQFKEKLLHSDDLDFVLFSSYAGGEKRLFYFDKSTINGIECVDLESGSIAFPKINDNEMVAYGKFSE